MAHKSGKGPNFQQGEGGGGKTSASGSHLEQGVGGARQGSSGSHLDQNPNNRPGPQGGSHLEQGQAHGSPRAPQRGGHSREGYDHTEMTGKSGSKNAQNPNFGK